MFLSLMCLLSLLFVPVGVRSAGRDFFISFQLLKREMSRFLFHFPIEQLCHQCCKTFPLALCIGSIAFFIKKLTELVGQLGELMLKVLELLSYLTLAEMAIKTMIAVWINL